jgi:hypothetical protein
MDCLLFHTHAGVDLQWAVGASLPGVSATWDMNESQPEV